MPMKQIKLAVLGGDKRQLSVAKELLIQGYMTEIWGIDRTMCSSYGLVSCENWGQVIDGCSVLILPLPASADGLRVNCPLLSEGSSVKVSKILDLIPTDTLVLGGKISPMLKNILTEKGFHFVDYSLREELQIKNAVPTAEGAIALAMNELSITIAEAKAAVVGYGRIGKILSSKLKALGADITVLARKTTDIALAETSGFHTIRLEISPQFNSLKELTTGYDVIFNTVPSWLFDENIVKTMNKSTLVIDLASAPGGIDIRAAKENGIKVIWALSLPGKCAPKTAGKIVAQTIIQILKEEGII